MSIFDFNSDDFEPEIPEFRPPSVESNFRAFNRVLPKEMQQMIEQAATLAYWKRPAAAEEIRKHAGYGGVSNDEQEEYHA